MIFYEILHIHTPIHDPLTDERESFKLQDKAGVCYLIQSSFITLRKDEIEKKKSSRYEY